MKNYTNHTKKHFDSDLKNFNAKTNNVKTHWGNVAESYDKYLTSDKNYHSEVVLPNLLRVITSKNDIKESEQFLKGKKVLDIACGQGQLASEFAYSGSNVEAFDAGEGLIKIAKENAKRDKLNINYKVLNAEEFAKEYYDKKFDIITCVLAIQNIENVKKVLDNIKLVSNENTKIYFVINHPSFRIPKYSEWVYDMKDGKDVQFRRVEKYMSEDKIKMDMTPGVKKEIEKEFTYSYHRPLQYYFKLFGNNGFAVTRLEEWISNRSSEGKHSERENISRKEFPLFMCLEVKLS